MAGKNLRVSRQYLRRVSALTLLEQDVMFRKTFTVLRGNCVYCQGAAIVEQDTGHIPSRENLTSRNF